MTIALFPLLFLTLELPKRIINDAIGSQSSQVFVLGVEIAQVHYLWLLCAAFLTSVLLHGLLKMRINTMKGILAERMLRRLRYSLTARMLRFPKPFFQRTSQGELVAMVTGETEPMGGMMGDALTQPVLQAGQMLTILFFLFLQSFWFGIAAIALIPFQAWLIPRLQRQINLMNKERIREVRNLAALIGETAAGTGTLRTSGGWPYRLAMMTEHLGVLFRIRFRIYQKKFFMKFINNFITQLTPFFFFAVGGYLVIQGNVSLGALVAALAAYKDLSSPWKELLTYYNQAQDMSLRWETVTEKFAPAGVIDAGLFEDPPTDVPRLRGTINLDKVCVEDADGNLVLDDISIDLPQGSLVGILARSEEDRAALADVLTREVIPVSGSVEIAGQNLSGVHQAVIARRIGHASSKPTLFRGTFGENVMMSVYAAPRDVDPDQAQALTEAIAAGNSADAFHGQWLSPERANASDEAELRQWWLTLVEAIGSDGPMFRKSLDQVLGAKTPPDLQDRLIGARERVWAAVEDAGLARYVHRFDPNHFNPGLPVLSNLFFATRKRSVSHETLLEQDELFALLHKLGLEQDLLKVAREIVELLSNIFGTDGTEHPLFRKLGLEPAVFEKSAQILQQAKEKPLGELDKVDKAVLLSLPAQISAEQIGPSFSDAMRDRIVDQRRTHSDKLQECVERIYAPLSPDRTVRGVSVLENVLYGKVADSAGPRAEDLRRIVTDVLEKEGLKSAVIDLIYDLPLGLNGTNLPALFAEPLSLIRAAIKRPDILVMDQILSSYDQSVRVMVHKNLRKLLPDTTLIYISDTFESPDRFDVFAEISQGRMRREAIPLPSQEDIAATADLQRKVRALESTELFSGLDRKQLRLLAFGSKWFSAKAGEVIFNKADAPTDGAYMLLAGEAELVNPQDDGEHIVATVGPGTLVGELGLIRNVPRALTMRAATDIEALRLGAEEFLAVVENDAATSFKLLQVVAGYTS